MPEYNYKCKECGHEILGHWKKISEDHLKECPECKKEGLALHYTTTPSVLYKGDWYEASGKRGKF